MKVRFWGVRGSIPAPGAKTAGVGGNTSCLEVTCGDQRLILDAGTGLRGLGASCRGEMPLHVHLFLSHTHWDHIQGLPFFIPIFIPGNRIEIYGADTESMSLAESIAVQMQAPHFPVSFQDLPSQIGFHTMQPGIPVEVGAATVRAERGNHPGGVLAYRIEYGGHSLVYATDTEHYADRVDANLVEFARETDLLIYDAMYTPAEYNGEVDGLVRHGWGHSTNIAGATLAQAANVGRYILFHHDPDQDDKAVAEKTAAARELFPRCEAAMEGKVIELD